ncbi:MAG TPA: hypothetical protein VMH35_03135 [Streptosporangiaceae bacterium]|nr:hypothetical protein [Streptosporangiaceae bacterium]
MKLLRFLTPALAAVAALCCGPGVAGAATTRPDAGNGFTISLTASAAGAHLGTPVTLTATANADVGPTPVLHQHLRRDHRR